MNINNPPQRLMCDDILTSKMNVLGNFGPPQLPGVPVTLVRAIQLTFVPVTLA